jgi:hypothetical protein
MGKAGEKLFKEGIIEENVTKIRKVPKKYVHNHYLLLQ